PIARPAVPPGAAALPALPALPAQWEPVAACQQQFLARAAEAQHRFLRSQRNAEAALLAARATFAHRGWQQPTRPTPGPTFDRGQLESLAGGSRVGDVAGPRFAGPDGYPGRIRLPRPPLLLIDRVTGIEVTPGSPGQSRTPSGTLWSETDVRPGGWYLD